MRLHTQAETVISVQQAIMVMAQHVHLVVTEELLHLVGPEQLVIVSTMINYLKLLKLENKTLGYNTTQEGISNGTNDGCKDT